MNKKQKQIRFKKADGTQYPDWEKKKLIELGDIVTGNTPSMKQKEYYTNGIYNWATAQDFTHKYIENTTVKLSENGKQKAKTLPKGSILVTCIASIGLNAILKQDSAFNQQINGLTPYKNYHGEFIYYLIDYNVPTIKKFSNQTAVPIINKTDFGLLRFSLPIDKNEQQKIAHFLSAIDKRITLLEDELTNLKAYKKGMMQRLFSRELRFKKDDGADYADWEERTLGEVAEIIGGGTPSTKKNEYWGDEISWFTPTEIKHKYSNESTRKISLLGLKKSSAKLLPIGTILLTTRATIGDASITTRECSTNQGFQNLIINAQNCNEFWYYWILRNKKEFIKKSSGSTFLEISKKEIAKIKCRSPHPDEQQKIAHLLSAIDKKITLSEARIAKEKEYKKGLMQGLFSKS